VVSHDVAETAEIADHIYMLSGGKIIEHGTPLDLRHSGSQWVQQFMRGLPDGPVPFHFAGPELADDLLQSEVKA
jgi:phospholipid/cholesterol/gamma-HCH transport system ATP-binding protein